MKETRQATRHRGHGRQLVAGIALVLITAGGLASAPAFGAETTSAVPAVTSQVPDSAMDAVAAMQPGWNLGNTLDAIPDETS